MIFSLELLHFLRKRRSLICLISNFRRQPVGTYLNFFGFMIRALAIQKFSNKFCSSQAQITFYQAFNFVDASVKKDERKTTNNVQRIRIIWLDLDRFCLDSDPCTCAVRIRIRRQFFNFFNIHILIIEPNPSEQNFVTGKIRICITGLSTLSHSVLIFSFTKIQINTQIHKS